MAARVEGAPTTDCRQASAALLLCTFVSAILIKAVPVRRCRKAIPADKSNEIVMECTAKQQNNKFAHRAHPAVAYFGTAIFRLVTLLFDVHGAMSPNTGH